MSVYMETYEQALAWLVQKRIIKNPNISGKERTRILLGALDNPQKNVPIIHVVGTSGKGSVATMISHLLVATGFKVGLQVTPYVCDVRERMQIQNQLLAREVFVRYVREVARVVDTLEARGHCFNYYDIATALMLYICNAEGVDYAVLEAGVGGRDARTNISAKHKMVVMTTISKDHEKTLGSDLVSIATAKAGAVQSRSLVVTPRFAQDIQAVIAKQCKDTKSVVYSIELDDCVSNISHQEQQSSATVRLPNKQMITVRSSLCGDHMLKNAALALHAVYFLSVRDHFLITQDHCRVFERIHMPGRFDQVMYKNKLYILDGAHNTEKVSALVHTIQQRYQNQKMHCIFSCKQGRSPDELLQVLAPVCASIVCTDFIDESNEQIPAVSLAEMQEACARLDTVPCQTVVSLQLALARVASLQDNCPVLITGSFYLVSRAYEQLK